MRALVQRVARARVSVDQDVVAAIERGLLVFVGVHSADTAAIAARLAGKVAALRIFEDDHGRMNRDAGEAGGAALCVPQFTLYGDVRRGNRPSFSDAAEPARAQEIFETFCAAIEQCGLRCGRGAFGAHMQVELVNDGPVTVLIDSADFDRPRRA
jgi:D-tyrosyl-tRNA(Tyr) deacylase